MKVKTYNYVFRLYDPNIYGMVVWDSSGTVEANRLQQAVIRAKKCLVSPPAGPCMLELSVWLPKSGKMASSSTVVDVEVSR